jgi:hypothetical protein
MQFLHGTIFIIGFAAAILEFWVESEWKQIRHFIAQPYLGKVRKRCRYSKRFRNGSEMIGLVDNFYSRIPHKG